MTIKIDQLGDAIFSAPGSLIVIHGENPPGVNYDAPAGSVQVSPWPDTPPGGSGDTNYHTFDVPVAGKYLVTANITLFGTGAVSVRYKLLFDENDSAEQTVGDDSDWEVRTASNAYVLPTLSGEVDLTAGTHTLKVYGQETNGTAWRIVGLVPVLAPQVTLQLISGSGAGGTLLSTAEKTSDQTISVNATATLLTDLSLTFTTYQDEQVEIGWFIPTYKNISTPTGRSVLYRVDSGSWVMCDFCSNEYEYTFVGTKILTLSAGSHTIDFAGEVNNQPMNFLGGDTEWLSGWGYYPKCSTWVRRFRGGLVPIRKDGYDIVGQPQAFDFVGPNVDITDIDGTATINFNGVAEGILVEEVALASTFTTSSTSFVDVDNGSGDSLSVTVDVVEGERIMLVLSGKSVHSGGANRIDIQYLVGATAYPLSVQGESNSSGYTTALGSFTPVITGELSAGSVTIMVQAQTSSTSIQILAGARLQVIRFRGGYIQPENAPIVDNVSDNQYEYVAAPGANDDLRLTFNNGVRYQATSPISMDISTTGLGGREPSAALTSGTWYYNYAVPDTNNSGYFGIIASDQHPGFGPADYSIYKYLGAVYYIDGSSKLRIVSQTGNKFDYPDATDSTLWLYDSGSGGATEITPTANTWYSFSTSGAGPGGGTQNDLRDAVPISAAQVDFSANMDTDGGEIYDLFIESGEVLYTPTISGASPGAFISCDLSARDANRALVPLHNGDAYFRWGSQNVGPISFLVIVRGYVDGYLADLESSMISGASTLDQAYIGGRAITADAGAVQIDASGDEALDLDGYVSLSEITDPNATDDDRGFLYAKNDDAYGTSELFFMDNYGQVTQITQDGYLATYNSLRGIRLLEGVELSQQVGSLSLYAKDSNGVTELFSRDSSGNETQITVQGRLGNGAIAAPGDYIEISDGQPSANIDINGSGAENQIIPDPAGPDAYMEFTARVSGIYRAMLGVIVNVPSGQSHTSAQFRLVFDEGEAEEQSVGYNEDWQTRKAPGGWDHTVFEGHVNLVAGVHKVTAYCKEVTAGSYTNDMDINGGSGPVGAPFIRLQAVTGSGAGGSLTDSISLTTDQTGIGGTWTDIDDGANKLELTFDTSEDETVFVYLRATATTSTAAGAWSRIVLDGTPVDESVRASYSSGGTNLDIAIPIAGLSAGSHTIKAQAYVSSGTLTIEGDATRGVSSLFITRYRGGLVPIQNDGYDLLGQPQAFNFTGNNIGVTDSNGAAEITVFPDGYVNLDEMSDPSPLDDAGLIYTKEVDGYTELHYMDDYGLSTQITNQGIRGTLVDAQKNSADVGSITTSFVTINTHNIVIRDGDEILIEASMSLSSSGASTPWLGYRIDSGTWRRFAATYIASGAWGGISGSLRDEHLTVGPHTVEIGLRVASVGTLTMNASTAGIPGRSAVWQFPG